jgi:tRNA(fMet)-specific endonuclease VapC
MTFEPVMVDTNILSYVFKLDSRAELYAKHLEHRQLLISFQTLAETDRWALERRWGTAKQKQFEQFINSFVEIGHNRSISRHWAQIMTQARAIGKPMPTADAWIAASALEVGCALVTHNPSDFHTVINLKIITELNS